MRGARKTCVCALLNWITDIPTQTDTRLFVFFGEGVCLNDAEVVALDYFFHLFPNGLKVCHVGRDSAAGKVAFADGADVLPGRCRRRRIPGNREEHMPLVFAVLVFMQYAGGIGNHGAKLLGGDKKFQDMLSVIFGDIHFIQRHREHFTGHNLIVVEAVRQQDTALAFRDFGKTCHRAGHVLQRLLQGGKAVVDIQNFLFRQNLTVIEKLLKIDGGIFHIVV